MKSRMIILLCCVIVITALTGCRLARPDGEIGAHEDRLAGILVTTRYLDLFDYESFINSSSSAITGGAILTEGFAPAEQGRLYAALKTRVWTDEETGGIIETEEYVFESVDGVACFYATFPGKQEHDSYIAQQSSDGLCDPYMYVSFGDETNSTILEGTIYVTAADGNRILFFNPVYQSADGRVYAVTGNSMGNSALTEREIYSYNVDAAYSVTEDGKTKTESASITVAVNVMFEPQKIVVLQMDKENTVIERTEYFPYDMPNSITPESGTAYLIVETHKRDTNGAEIISRQIIEPGEDQLESYQVGSSFIFVRQQTKIEW